MNDFGARKCTQPVRIGRSVAISSSMSRRPPRSESASPIQQILAPLEPAQRAAAWAAMEARLARFDTAAGWEGPNELLLTAARR